MLPFLLTIDTNTNSTYTIYSNETISNDAQNLNLMNHKYNQK